MVGVIASQIQEQDIDAVLLGGDGWDGIQNDFADVAKGNFFANHYATDDPDPIVQNFITAYKDAYGETPNALGALAYDATNVLLGAIETAGSTKGEDIKEAMAATDVDAVCGHITFDENGDPVKAISMLTVNDAGELQLEAKVSE
jgi:branched-chain amino acid transport system substrate-binding protein